MKRSDELPRILLVEDEPLTREQLGELLEAWPAKIYQAENGEKGLALYFEIRPDIVITDVVMPVMNGLEMARRIRSHDPKARIIAITAYGEAEDFADRDEVLTDHCVLKPIDMATLFGAMNQLKVTISEEKGLGK